MLDTAIAAWSGAGATPALAALAPLGWISVSSGGLLLALALVGGWLGARVRARAAPAVGTWDCGYAAPTTRMQYTSSSFADLIVGLLGWALVPSTRAPRGLGPVPKAASFHSHVPDTVLDRAVLPAFALGARLLGRLRPFQAGNLHLYLLYILGALFALLLWR